MSEVEFFELTYDESEYVLSDEAFETALIGTYQRVFNRSPYRENFDYELAEEIIKGVETADTEGVVAVHEGLPVGFAWGEVLQPADQELFPDDISGSFFEGDSYYFAELGVLPSYRDQGIGKELKNMEMQEVMQREDVDRGLMRTSIKENEKKLGLDSDLGFRPLEKDGEIVTEEVDTVGREDSDLRGYFWRCL